MPITPQQKLEILQKVGVDSDKYWLDDEGKIVDLPKDTSAMAGVKTALLNLPRTAAGVGGAAAGTAGAGLLGAPSGPGAIATGVAGGFAGAALGSTLGEKIQQALYPEDVLLAQQARQVRNPGATQLGDLASQAVFFRPSISQTRDLGRAIRTLTTTPSFSKLRPAQAAAGLNTLLGAGLGAGTTMAEGGDLSEIAKNAAIGAVFSNPTGLTRAMTGGVFSPHVADISLRDAVNPADLIAKAGEQATPKTAQVDPELIKAYAKQQKADAKLAEQLAAMRLNQEAAAKRAQIEATMGIGADQPLPAQDYVLPQNLDTLEARLRGAQAVEPDVNATIAPQAPPPLPKQGPPPLPGTPGALDAELGTRPTKAFFDWWKELADVGYRTRMRTGRPTDEQGRPVAGVTQPGRDAQGVRDITIAENPYTDTAPHELTHGMILDVLQNGKKGEQAEMRRLLKAAGVEEEAFVQGVGEDVVRRFMDKTDDSWRSDFMSFMKYKFGKATPADIRRVMSNTMLRSGGPKAVDRLNVKQAPQREREAEKPASAQGKPPVMPETRPERLLPYIEEGKATSESLTAGAEGPEVTLNEMDAALPFNERRALPFNERRALPPAQERPPASTERRTLPGTPERGQLTYEPLGDVRGTLEQGAEPTNIEGVRESGELTAEERYAAEDARIRRLEEEAAMLRRRRDFPRAMKQAEGNPPSEPRERLVGSERRGREREAKRALRSADLENADLSNVARPETIDYTSESIPTNMRRGREIAANKRESAADLEARRIEAELSGEEKPRYQKFGEDRTFATDFEKELSKDAPFKIQASKDGRLNRNDIKAAVSKLNPTEQEMLREAGLEQYLTKVARPNKEELMAWAEENMPRVEVKELAADQGVSAMEQDAAALRHELETKYGSDFDARRDDLLSDPEFRRLDNQYRQFMEQIHDAKVGQMRNDSATARYTQVNPRELKDMPGAVDLLVRMPAKVNPATGDGFQPEWSRKVAKYPASSTHYAQSGDNLLAHVRAYEHTMPDGERVLRVFEVQSDWAQARRKAEARGKEREAEGGISGAEYADKSVPNDPLLAQHQRLALKAAIEHARKRGIKRVVIDDAETAMLTEGHDRIIRNAQQKVAKTNADFRANIGNMPQRVLRHIALHNLESLFGNSGAKFEYRDGLIVMTRGPFEGGMKLSYDNVLQQQMRDLAGEGVKVELGTHKNAVTQRSERIEGTNTEDADSIFDTSEWRTIEEPRQDLIFKNPDGTPKTTSTGYIYDVSAPQARREAGEPFSYAGRRYQAFGPNRPTSGLPDVNSRLSFSPFESASQKVARSANPVMRTVGRALTELFPAQRAMQGKYRALAEAFEGLNEKDSDILYKLFIDEYRDEVSYAGKVPARLRKEYNDVRRTLADMRIDEINAGQKNMFGATPKIDPQYFPNIVDPSVRKTIVDEIDSPRYNKLRDEFLQFNSDYLVRKKGMSVADADKKASDYFNRFIGTLKKQPVAGSFDFGAVSLPAGSRLPDNWLHSNPAQALAQYTRDWSRARSFYDVVQTNDKVMAGLGQDDYYVGGVKTPVTTRVTPVVKDNNILYLLNEAVGMRRGSQDKITGAVGRAASAMWLANPVTRSVDIATSLFKGLGMVTPGQIPGLVSNLRNIGKSYEAAQNTGWIKSDGNTIVGEVLGAGEAFSNGVDKFSRGLSKYTGSEKLENFGRGLSQNIGEYIARTNSALAKSGNKRSARFLDQVAPNWRSLSDAELGTRIGQLFQGKYDATNLPQWLSDSPAAPFFSLARWNIEQWNNFREFAIKPARNGDPAPLISMTLAGLVGGVGIKEIREALSGRKSKIATLKEIMEAPEGSAKYKEAVRYFGNLAQLSGTMGIVSEMSNWGLDIASKDMPAAASMPALEVTRDIIPRLIAAGNAIMDGEDPLTVITQVGRDIGNEHVSAYRFIENNLGRTGVWDEAGEDLADANARRDLRVGKRLRGEPIKAAVQLPIDYSRAEERAVEKTRDIPEMINKARELRADIKADPDRENRERRLRSAAASRPSYMPSRENNPKAFREQLDFVRRTQGEDKANELLKRYLRDKKAADIRRRMMK